MAFYTCKVLYAVAVRIRLARVDRFLSLLPHARILEKKRPDIAAAVIPP